MDKPPMLNTSFQSKMFKTTTCGFQKHHYYSVFAKKLNQERDSPLNKSTQSLDCLQQHSDTDRERSIFSRKEFRRTLQASTALLGKRESPFKVGASFQQHHYQSPLSHSQSKPLDKRHYGKLRSHTALDVIEKTDSVSSLEKLSNKRGDELVNDLNDSLLGIFKELPDSVKVPKFTQSDSKQPLFQSHSLLAMQKYFKNHLLNKLDPTHEKSTKNHSLSSTTLSTAHLPKHPIRNVLFANQTQTTPSKKNALDHAITTQDQSISHSGIGAHRVDAQSKTYTSGGFNFLKAISQPNEKAKQSVFGSSKLTQINIIDNSDLLDPLLSNPLSTQQVFQPSPLQQKLLARSPKYQLQTSNTKSSPALAPSITIQPQKLSPLLQQVKNSISIKKPNINNNKPLITLNKIRQSSQSLSEKPKLNSSSIITPKINIIPKSKVAPKINTTSEQQSRNNNVNKLLMRRTYNSSQNNTIKVVPENNNNIPVFNKTVTMRKKNSPIQLMGSLNQRNQISIQARNLAMPNKLFIKTKPKAPLHKKKIQQKPAKPAPVHDYLKDIKQYQYKELLNKKVTQAKYNQRILPLIKNQNEEQVVEEWTPSGKQWYNRSTTPTPHNFIGKIDRILKKEKDQTKRVKAMGEVSQNSRFGVVQEKLMVANENQIERFMGVYKNIERIMEIEDQSLDSSQEQLDPIIQYLKHAKKNNMPPLKMAFKRSRPKDKLEEEEDAEEDIAYNLKAIHITNQFAEAFTENLKCNPRLNYLILQSSQLNDLTFATIVPNLPKDLKKLDLSRNPELTAKSYKLLCDKLIAMHADLTHLNLEGNELGDEACRYICEMVTKLGTLYVLNLSKCAITDIGAEYIANMLRCKHVGIRALVLHWNKILGRGAVHIAKALEQNENLLIFDASFNSFGSSTLQPKKETQNAMPDFEFITSKNRFSSYKELPNPDDEGTAPEVQYTMSATQWSRTFTINKTLIHADFSFNNFRLTDVQCLGDALKQNHTLLGFHLMGNEATVDELGFVLPEKPRDLASTHVFTRIPLVLRQGNVKNKHLMQLHVSSNCWICEGWSQFEFKIHKDKVENLIKNDDFRERFLAKYGVACKLQVSIHMSHDGYKPHKMTLNIPPHRDYYQIFRMVPPGKLNYFFTVGYSKEIEKGDQKNLKHLHDEKAPFLITDNQIIATDETEVVVPRLNYIEGDIMQISKVLTSTEIRNMKALPRPEQASTPRPKTPWTFEKSFFKKYPPFFEDTWAQCFEFDWNCSKIEKWMSNSSRAIRDNAYEYLKGQYKQILEAYRYLSALAPSGKYWSIGTNVFSDTVQNCKGLVDYITIKQSDVDLEFISTKASGNQIKWPTNPERQLIRYQFLEILVRLALSKYFKTKYCKSMDLAIIKCFEDNVMPYFNQFNSHDFRELRMYNEPCDTSVQRHLSTLKDIYQKYSGREALGGETKYMSQTEFNDLVLSTQVVDENFGSREINIIFNVSMNAQVDEIRSDRHCKMQFHEFVEAMCRVADRVVVNLIGLNQAPQTATDESMSDDEVIQQLQSVQIPKMGSTTNVGPPEYNSKTSVDSIDCEDQLDPKNRDQAQRERSVSSSSSASSASSALTLEQQPTLSPGKLEKDLKPQQQQQDKPTQATGHHRRKHHHHHGNKKKKKEIPLGDKLTEFIRKVALMSMGSDYAYNYIRKNNLQSLAFLYYSSWTSNDQWVMKQLANKQQEQKTTTEQVNNTNGNNTVTVSNK